MQINNTQNNTNFKGFTVPKSSQRRFMRALREECNTSDLIKIRNTMENQVKNPEKIKIIDWGYMFGQPVNGNLFGTVNGKEYSNSSLFKLSSWSLPKFIQKLAKKADNAFLKKEKRKATNIIEECIIDSKTKMERKKQAAETKLEIKNALRLQKEKKVSAEEQNHYLLGEIYKLIQG